MLFQVFVILPESEGLHCRSGISQSPAEKFAENRVLKKSPISSHLVTVPAGYNLQPVLTFFGCSPVTRVELELNLGVKVVACWHCDQVTWHAGAHDRLSNHVRWGIQEERCFLGPNAKPVDSASKRLQHMGQWRSSVLL